MSRVASPCPRGPSDAIRSFPRIGNAKLSAESNGIQGSSLDHQADTAVVKFVAVPPS